MSTDLSPDTQATTTSEPEGMLPARAGFPGMPGDFGTMRARRRIPTQTIVLLIVLAVSAAALYFMRQYGMKSGMTFDPILVSYEEQDGEKARTYERIMADLARIQTPLDIALDDFGKSPFILYAPKTSTLDDFTPVEGATAEERALEEARRAAAQRHTEREAVIATLDLQGVMGGSVPLARVNNETYRVGDQVAGVFTVTKIEGRGMVLSAEGVDYPLEMDAGNHGGPKKGAVKMGATPGAPVRR